MWSEEVKADRVGILAMTVWALALVVGQRFISMSRSSISSSCRMELLWEHRLVDQSLHLAIPHVKKQGWEQGWWACLEKCNTELVVE